VGMSGDTVATFGGDVRRVLTDSALTRAKPGTHKELPLACSSS
jgi:hypothetical protein